MPKPPLPMRPTGWFQVAWSAEVAIGQVHRVKALGEELVAWRGRSGQVTVMDAYCQHLGANLGYGGTVELPDPAGGGGIGDLAIRYGYYRFQTDVMVLTVALLVVLVQIIQVAGNTVARRIDKR